MSVRTLESPGPANPGRRPDFGFGPGEVVTSGSAVLDRHPVMEAKR